LSFVVGKIQEWKNDNNNNNNNNNLKTSAIIPVILKS
jgi:hypothetical protein